MIIYVPSKKRRERKVGKVCLHQAMEKVARCCKTGLPLTLPNLLPPTTPTQHLPLYNRRTMQSPLCKFYFKVTKTLRWFFKALHSLAARLSHRSYARYFVECVESWTIYIIHTQFIYKVHIWNQIVYSDFINKVTIKYTKECWYYYTKPRQSED